MPSSSPSRPVSPVLARDGPSPSLKAAGEFEGYASLFGVPDLGRDVVAPGAFRESLSRKGPNGIRMLWQHDPAEPVGRWISLSEDGRGLRVRGRLNASVTRAREIAALLEQGAIDGLSIGFRVVEAERVRGSGLRRLVKLDLWEISIVTFPMLPGARVAAGIAPDRRTSDPLAPAIRAAARRISFTPATRMTWPFRRLHTRREPRRP